MLYAYTFIISLNLKFFNRFLMLTSNRYPLAVRA
jgi:hypothetical protein